MVDFVPIPTNPSAATNQTFVPSPANKQDQQFYDDTAIGEIGEGVVSGVIGIGEGLLGLGATAVDLIADTDYGTKVTEGAESLRDTLGLDPEGFLGKGAEIVTQFVVPGIGAAAKAGKLVRAARTAAGKTGPMTKAERFGLAAAELGAAGLADAVVVSASNMSTIGDWVGAGPTQTDELIGLRGRERALGPGAGVLHHARGPARARHRPQRSTNGSSRVGNRRNSQSKC
jgi:hypothetical protein